MNLSYRIALVCGAVPLLTGVTIFLLWLITGWDWLMLAGYFTMFGGVLLFLIGAAFLASFRNNVIKTPSYSRRRLWVSMSLCGGLLLANFPAAAGITYAVFSIKTGYTVTIANLSTKPLTAVRVFGGGCDLDFGTILPNSTSRRTFFIQADGELQYEARCGDAFQTATVDGYVTGNQGGDTKITVNPDCTLSIADLRAPK